MESLEKNAKVIALLLLLLLAGGALRVNLMRVETEKLLAREIPRNLGMGDTLKAMVENLEADLAARASYEPEEMRDPLALRKVVRMPAKVPAGEEVKEGRMRLSATLLSPDHFTAIVKYRGSSYSLGMGDSLDGHVVRSIDKRTVTLEYQGKTLVLVNEPAPKAEAQVEGGSRRVRSGSLEELQL